MIKLFVFFKIIMRCSFGAIKTGINGIYDFTTTAFEYIAFSKSNIPGNAYHLAASALRQSRLERHYAENLFNAVTDHDLLDHYVFLMLAAEKKYSYYLKKARMGN